ncbi:hypothetical protein ABKV19_017360, partial [Rosa sericea]
MVDVPEFKASVSETNWSNSERSLGPLTKHFSSLVKWTRAASAKAPQSDGNVVQFESGYLVETVMEGTDIGVVPFKIRISEDGELFAVDSVNSNIVRITPPLSQCMQKYLLAVDTFTSKYLLSRKDIIPWFPWMVMQNFKYYHSKPLRLGFYVAYVFTFKQC